MAKNVAFLPKNFFAPEDFLPKRKNKESKNTNSIFDFVDLSQECDHVDEDDTEADYHHRDVAERDAEKGRKFNQRLSENNFL